MDWRGLIRIERNFDLLWIETPQSIWIGVVWFYSNPYGLRGIEGVLIPNKSKYLLIRINPFQSIWIENNRRNPKGLFGSTPIHMD
jgi:hypothetical protein